MIIVIMVVLYLLFLLWCDQQILSYIFITFLGTTYQFRTRNSINAAPDYFIGDKIEPNRFGIIAYTSEWLQKKLF